MAWGFPVANPAADLRARALRLLARREHSRAELRRKLSPHVEGGIDLEALLDDFTKRGWLSEERFVEQTVRAKSRKYGPLKIANHLREKGIGEADIESALSQAKSEEGEALASAWRTRFGRPPADDAEKAKQVRFLQQRGFPLESVLRFLKAEPQDFA
ncbi:MAG: recombination regulator RecX [Betaproteobacteria bacterium]|nr:recombination regulator RecX [Betaproteobacteria bacterium]